MCVELFFNNILRSRRPCFFISPFVIFLDWEPFAGVACIWWNNRVWVYRCFWRIFHRQNINISYIWLEIHIVNCLVIGNWPNSKDSISYLLKINILFSSTIYNLANRILDTCASIKATFIFKKIIVGRNKVPFVFCLIEPVVICDMVLISTNYNTFVILYACNGNISLGVEVLFAYHFNGTVKVITLLERVSD